MSDELIARCALETGGRNLWLSFGGGMVTVRLRVTGAVPAPLLALRGLSVGLSQVLALLPRLEAGDFIDTGQSVPEIRADRGNWHISVIMPSPPPLSRERPRLVTQLRQWAADHLFADDDG